jgi:hypothetical protein
LYESDWHNTDMIGWITQADRDPSQM